MSPRKGTRADVGSATKESSAESDDAMEHKNEQGITGREQRLFEAIQRNPKGMDIRSLQRILPEWNEEEMMVHLNQLSAKRLVDFIQAGKGKQLAFRARDTTEIMATANLSEYERIMYMLIKEAKDNGIWIKDLKARSGMHHQQATATIKSLEKQNIIKSVRPVKTPFKRVYLLYDQEPSSELTGGAWYTDNELDVDFIEKLSGMIFKFIQAKSLPKNIDALYPETFSHYPTVVDVYRFIEVSKITSFKLSLDDVKALVNRLYYEGKIVRVENPDEAELPASLEGTTINEEDLVIAYRTIRGVDMSLQRSAFTSTPCGKCPVFDFCQSDGPVNPASCEYFSRWLTF